MLSSKGRGRHSAFGSVYFWCLLALFGSATVLSIMRLSKNYYLFILGAAAFGCAWFGRSASLQLRWPNWGRLHISGISLSYIVMLTAFYVDNGKQLPIVAPEAADRLSLALTESVSPSGSLVISTCSTLLATSLLTTNAWTESVC